MVARHPLTASVKCYLLQGNAFESQRDCIRKDARSPGIGRTIKLQGPMYEN